MARKYKLYETIDAVRSHLNEINTLYKQSEINWKGVTRDTGEVYTEIIAGEILKNINSFGEITSIKRNNSYITESHKNPSPNPASTRNEEKFAINLLEKEIDKLGKIIEYQVPLKDKRRDAGLGKIDLISFNKKINTLYLIELKYTGNKETLLRAVLESYTYFRLICKEKLSKDFERVGVPSKIEIKPAVLMVKGCNAFNEFEELRSGGRLKLKKLCKKIHMNLYTINSKNKVNSIVF